MRYTTVTIVTAAAALLAVEVGPVAAQAREPQWQKSQALCRQLRAEGWKGSPEGPGDPGTGELRHGSIYVCRVRQAQPARAGAKPSLIDVFLQHGGGDNLTVVAEIWAAADQAATLAAAATTMGRAARELGIALPADLLANLTAGETWEDEAGGLRFDISKSTREGEMLISPDLKPSDVPLVVFEVTVEPAS